jgi:hypothetical protein
LSLLFTAGRNEVKKILHCKIFFAAKKLQFDLPRTILIGISNGYSRNANGMFIAHLIAEHEKFSFTLPA